MKQRNIIKDLDSGFNDISDELPEEELGFDGGSASELRAQDFFTQTGTVEKNP